MSAVLTLDCVTKSFPDAAAPALDGVTLTVPSGSCTAIVGPSGSGKSTILRVMAGLDLVSGGQVLVDGVDVAGLAPERRGMGMVFQRPLLFPHLSVLDNVAFAERVSGVSRATSRRNAERYLEMVQLGGYGTRSIDALSGGQEQRVAIARALAARPSVLLLDEPFSALDPALRSDMHELIDQIRQAVAPTIVMVTHDRDEASAVADRIAVLHEGELLQHDTVDRVYNRPMSLRVSRLMGGLNEVHGTVTDGVHHSPLGAVELPDATPSGPGILVVRQEAVAVRALGGASAEGSGLAGGPDSAGGSGWADGSGLGGGSGSMGGAGFADGSRPAVGSGSADGRASVARPGSADALPGELVGVVRSIRQLGPRRLLTIGAGANAGAGSAGDEVELAAELPPGQNLEVGSPVALQLPLAAVSVVPA